MRALKRHLPFVALAGLLAAVLPGLAHGTAPPNSADVVAQDFNWQVAGTSAHQATIAVGGTVTFSYPSGASAHNADFGASAPASCTQTAGPSSGSVPPLPAAPAAPGWSGTCTFTAAGTYAFHCDLHPSMSGTVVVVDPNAPPPPTTTGAPPAPPSPISTTPTGPTTTGTVPTSPSPTPAPPGRGSPTAPPTAPPPQPSTPVTSARPATATLVVAGRQRGTVVRGTVVIRRAGRLTIDALAPHASLAAAAVRQDTVGRTAARPVRSGLRRFALTLNARGRRALLRRKQLTVMIRAALATPGIATARDTATVTLRTL